MLTEPCRSVFSNTAAGSSYSGGIANKHLEGNARPLAPGTKHSPSPSLSILKRHDFRQIPLASRCLLPIRA
jgi:hypothetical protein